MKIKKLILEVFFANEIKELRSEFKSILQEEVKRFEESRKKFEEIGTSAIGRLDWFMTEYHASICDGCKRPFLAHHGGFYRSEINGRIVVHCSGVCLDKTVTKQP